MRLLFATGALGKLHFNSASYLLTDYQNESGRFLPRRRSPLTPRTSSPPHAPAYIFARTHRPGRFSRDLTTHLPPNEASGISEVTAADLPHGLCTCPGGALPLPPVPGQPRERGSAPAALAGQRRRLRCPLPTVPWRLLIYS